MVAETSAVSPPCVKNVEMRKIRKRVESIDLRSEAAFPPLPTTPQTDVQRKRRINPTQLSPGSPTVYPVKFGSAPRPSQGSPANPFSQVKEQIKPKNLDQERALLMECKSKAAARVVHLDVSSSAPQKSWACIEPERDLVTEQRALDRLCALYVFCLAKNLLPAFAEIKFLLELLLLRVSPLRCRPAEGQSNSALRVLDSVHNCVYFSSQTLCQMDDWWWTRIDRSSLQLLSDNARLAKFAAPFSGKIRGHLSGRSLDSSRQLSRKRTIGNVAFQSDTDNRYNFASDASFHTFRKQRDQFCEVWQIWKQNCSSAEWNMAAVLQRRIQSLVDLKRDCVNYVHLARLFRSQLLDVARLVDDVEESGPLGLLQSSDPVKLRRLRERLVNPPENRASVVSVVFEGDQEFFRDFILLAGSAAFNEHLKNCLVSGIEELSSAAAVVREDCADDRGVFAETLTALRVLAKFLGLLAYHPHESSSGRLPEHIAHQLSRLRANDAAPVDLVGHVDDAFRRRRLVLVLPWVVTLLSMADPVSLSLPACNAALAYLVFIYRQMATADHFDAESAFLVRMLLSWMFDQELFPRALLVQSDEQLWSLVERATRRSREQQQQQGVEPSVPTEAEASLDQWSLVDCRLVYQCCPFLGSWKTLLADFATDMNWAKNGSKSLGRKITPVAAEDPSSSSFSSLSSSSLLLSSPAALAETNRPKQPHKSMQLLLEENFFHNQPPSVKRTVDFASERLASNVVRDVRNRVIAEVAAGRSTEALECGSAFSVADRRLESLSDRLCDEVRRQALVLLNSATTLLGTTLDVLLPNDVLPQVRRLCHDITVRLTREKVLEWLDRHVTSCKSVETELIRRRIFIGFFYFVLFLSLIS